MSNNNHSLSSNFITCNESEGANIVVAETPQLKLDNTMFKGKRGEGNSLENLREELDSVANPLKNSYIESKGSLVGLKTSKRRNAVSRKSTLDDVNIKVEDGKFMHINEKPSEMYDQAFLASVRPRDMASDLQILSASQMEDGSFREKITERPGLGSHVVLA